MENSVIIQVLSTLSKPEWRELGKWVRSTAHNQDDEVIRLFEHLQASIAGRRIDSGLVIARKAFGKDTDDTDHLHHVSSYLMKVVTDYLLWAEQSGKPAYFRHYQLTQIFRRRQLGKLARRFYEKAQGGFSTHNNRGLPYYADKVGLLHEKVRLEESGAMLQHHDLQPLLEAQDIRFIIEKLQTGCLMLSQKAVSSREYDLGMLNLLTRFLEGHEYLNEPAVALYYHGYRALSDTDGEPHFQRLKRLLDQYGAGFEAEELRNLYLLAINFCIRKINRSERTYLREVFELYQSGLQVGAFLENGQMSRFTYTNIAQAGIGLGEFDWVSVFLTRYKPYLPEDIRESVSQFSLARLYYENKQPGKALECLLNIGHDDTVYNFAAKTLLAKIYFEQHEWNALDSLLDSISVYIRRKKVAGYHRDSYSGFVKIMRLILSKRLSERQDRSLIREKIISMKVLAEREWLLGLVE